MKQEQFEAQGRERWRAFEATLDALAEGDREAARSFPHAYRRICQDLALARDRHFSRTVLERLNQLALRGHHQLYSGRGRGRGFGEIARFVARDFPRAVRSEWRLVLLVSLLFYGFGGAIAASIQLQPELSQSFLDPATIDAIEQMYGEGPQERAAESDVTMFGFYVLNNVSIAFRTFASGLLFGIGTLFIICYNALHIGAIFGHLTRVGMGTNLYTFVVAHGALELTAILLAGVAGMRLGLSLVAPGDKSRLQALRDAARRALPLVYGTGGMLVLAAAVEAFWSPRTFEPALKYGVGAAFWLFVIAYFLLAGVRGAHRPQVEG